MKGAVGQEQLHRGAAASGAAGELDEVDDHAGDGFGFEVAGHAGESRVGVEDLVEPAMGPLALGTQHRDRVRTGYCVPQLPPTTAVGTPQATRRTANSRMNTDLPTPVGAMSCSSSPR